MSVSFQSPGIIDYRCITTVGASVKEGDNPIGFFGTGLKYAIAIILRNGGTIDIYRGMERLRFTSKNVPIRGKDFQVVCMNDKEMGFTTEYGKTWKMWQAFRELYCNTLDEKGWMQTGTLAGKPGHTTVVVNCAEFELTALEKSKYILETQPIQRMSGYVEFHGHGGSDLYYRKVLVAEQSKPYRFTPNILGQIALTEDRTVRDWWAVDSIIGAGLMRCKDEAFLEEYLTVGEDYAEYNQDLINFGVDTSVLCRVARKLFQDPITYPLLNRSIKAYLKSQEGDPDIKAANILPAEQKLFDEAVQFCKDLSYNVDEYHIVIAETLGENVLGTINSKKRTIYVSRRAVQNGKHCLAATLIEEWVHLKHRHQDCSRAMQNWLLEQLTLLGDSYLMSKG